MYLLDTDILSHLIKRSPSAALISKLVAVPAEHQFSSSIILGELVYGAHRPGPRSTALLSQIETRLIPNLSILPFNASAARRYG